MARILRPVQPYFRSGKLQSRFRSGVCPHAVSFNKLASRLSRPSGIGKALAVADVSICYTDHFKSRNDRRRNLEVLRSFIQPYFTDQRHCIGTCNIDPYLIGSYGCIPADPLCADGRPLCERLPFAAVCLIFHRKAADPLTELDRLFYGHQIKGFRSSKIQRQASSRRTIRHGPVGRIIPVDHICRRKCNVVSSDFACCYRSICRKIDIKAVLDILSELLHSVQDRRIDCTLIIRRYVQKKGRIVSHRPEVHFPKIR